MAGKTSGTKKRQVEYRPVAELVPYANNSRTHSEAQVAQIAASIREFGWTNPILVDEDGGVIAGHGRLLAAQQMGESQVPCIVIDGLSDAQRRALVIADNKLALNAGWDEALLESEIRGLDDDGFDVALLGFDADDLAGLLGHADDAGMPALRDGDKPEFQQMTFTLHDRQADTVQLALAKAKERGQPDDGPNENSNGNALATIAAAYLAKEPADA